MARVSFRHFHNGGKLQFWRRTGGQCDLPGHREMPLGKNDSLRYILAHSEPFLSLYSFEKIGRFSSLCKHDGSAK